MGHRMNELAGQKPTWKKAELQQVERVLKSDKPINPLWAQTNLICVLTLANDREFLKGRVEFFHPGLVVLNTTWHALGTQFVFTELIFLTPKPMLWTLPFHACTQRSQDMQESVCAHVCVCTDPESW